MAKTSVVITSVQAKGNGAGSVWVKIRNPYGTNDFHMEVPVDNLNNIQEALKLARSRVFQFATELAAASDPQLKWE